MKIIVKVIIILLFMPLLACNNGISSSGNKVIFDTVTTVQHIEDNWDMTVLFLQNDYNDINIFKIRQYMIDYDVFIHYDNIVILMGFYELNEGDIMIFIGR
jgi:hypothetical protein